MNGWAADLDALREAAHKRQWVPAQEALTRLFLALDFYAALEIALTRAHNHLPAFERCHPEAAWARQLLVSMAAYGAAPNELPPEAALPYTSPGAANYIMALFELCRALERRTPLENRVRFLANAVANTLLAELAVSWYGQHSDAWTRQQEHGDEVDPQTGLTVRQQIYMQFWLDGQIAQQDTSAWLDIAVEVEKKIS